MPSSAGGVKTYLHHENPIAVGSVEGWRVRRKRKRSLQCWLRQQPHRQDPGGSSNGCRGSRAVGLIQKDQSGAGASAWLCSLQTQSPGFERCKLTPQTHAVFAEDKHEFSFLSVVFLYLSSKNLGKGKILGDWGNFSPHSVLPCSVSIISIYKKLIWRKASIRNRTAKLRGLLNF